MNTPDPVSPWMRSVGHRCPCNRLRDAKYFTYGRHGEFVFACVKCGHAKGVFGRGFAKFSAAKGLEQRLV